MRSVACGAIIYFIQRILNVWMYVSYVWVWPLHDGCILTHTFKYWRNVLKWVRYEVNYGTHFCDVPWHVQPFQAFSLSVSPQIFFKSFKFFSRLLWLWNPNYRAHKFPAIEHTYWLMFEISIFVHLIFDFFLRCPNSIILFSHHLLLTFFRKSCSRIFFGYVNF